MGDPNKLSAYERQVYERLKTVCTNFKSLPPDMQNLCVVQKMQLEQDAKQKQRALAEAAGFARVERQMSAFMYVNQIVHARQNEAILLSLALQKASAEYDTILSTRAAAPIIGDIVFGLATSFLPAVKVLSRITKRYASAAQSTAWRLIGHAAAKSSATGWEKLADDIMNSTATKIAVAVRGTARPIEKMEKFAEVLDEASKHMLDAVQHPLEASEKLDEASRDRVKAWQSKNQIISGIGVAINRQIGAITLLEPILYLFILWYNKNDLVGQLKQMVVAADLDSPATNNPNDYDVLAAVILYDMLHLYTKSNFKVKVKASDGSVNINNLRDYWPEDQIEGLDEAQRKLIYQRFGKVAWQDPTRPPVNSFKDLLKYWGGALEQPTAAEIEEERRLNEMLMRLPH